MEFRIAKDEFNKALQRIQGIVEKRNTMPILANALLETKGDRLFVTATDLEVGMNSAYTADVVQDGKITVSAKKLYEIVREMPDSEITFRAKDNDWIELLCGKARFNIVGLSSEEFPYFPKVKEDTLVPFKTDVLREMILKTAFSICDDETKYNLNGIFMKIAEGDQGNILEMVSTDGHRLSLAEKSVSGAVSAAMRKGIILPKKGVAELKKMVEEEAAVVLFGFIDNSAVFKKDDTVVVMRLIDGDFPNYRSVVPAGNSKTARADRVSLLHALKRMAILSSDKFKGVKIEIENNLMVISSNNPELGEAREEVEVKYEEMTAFSARFNAAYIVDVLAATGTKEVDLKLKDELAPLVVKPTGFNDYAAVIMPMRL